MINNVVLVGRLTKDPELKVTGSNIHFVNFTIAVNRAFADQDGERQADFINCIVWRKQAENLARYMRQGSLIGIEGRIQTRSYETEQGMRYITEVVCNSIQFLENKSNNDSSNVSNNTQEEFYETSKKLVTEDDLPF